MPIRKDLRHFYGREWRLVTRPRILARAGNKCEQCGVPNHTEVTRVGGAWLEVLVSRHAGATLRWHDNHGRICDDPAGAARQRHVRVVLTIAHLNHRAGDDRDDNLRALCQYCHLHFDAEHHRESRQIRKDQSRPLLMETTKEAAC